MISVEDRLYLGADAEKVGNRLFIGGEEIDYG
jgi:hypothetical protein